jgi:hypothetical protein
VLDERLVMAVREVGRGRWSARFRVHGVETRGTGASCQWEAEGTAES